MEKTQVMRHEMVQLALVEKVDSIKQVCDSVRPSAIQISRTANAVSEQEGWIWD